MFALSLRAWRSAAAISAEPPKQDATKSTYAVPKFATSATSDAVAADERDYRPACRAEQVARRGTTEVLVALRKQVQAGQRVTVLARVEDAPSL